MNKILLNLAFFVSFSLSLTALAHEELPQSSPSAASAIETQPEIKEEIEIEIKHVQDCPEHPDTQSQSGPPSGHEGHHHAEESYDRAFAEGTPTLFSPSTLNPDTFTLLYAHNFFWSTLPRSANPAFWFKYSPLQNLQADFMATLRNPLELEVGLAYQILDEDRGDWLNLTPRIAYNSRGNLVGAEVAASKYIFPELWQVGLDARILSTGKPDGFDRPVAAMGFNTMVRVWNHWHLFGDVVIPFDSEILQTKSVLWTAGIKKRIPHTPHILTLFVGNAQEQSLSGRTISPSNVLADNFRLGFVFSIQIPQISDLPSRLF